VCTRQGGLIAAHKALTYPRAMPENSTTNDDFGVRPGEITVPLPDDFDASVYFIGRIRTPWVKREDCPKNARESDTVCTIEVDQRWEAALQGIETCTHLVVLYWMDKSRRDIAVQFPRHYQETRGTFALRSPARPNPIAMSAVALKEVRGRLLSVTGLDCLDNTPLIDIKPYFPSIDSVPDAIVGWHRDRK
jgi:tRNA-Thr(GGU) m(6)t(6)A37 methyltransferase TsaA